MSQPFLEITEEEIIAMGKTQNLAEQLGRAMAQLCTFKSQFLGLGL
jgi:hypothetical protein